MLPRLAVRALRPPALTLELKSATTLLPLTLVRSYALSRYPERGSRLHRNPKASTITPPPSPPLRLEPASQETVSENELLLERNPDSGGLEKLLANDTLVVVRQIEFLNLFAGFEVANRYAINDVNGNVVGYIAEEDKGFSGALARQAFRTHRAFRSVIMDVNGTPVLWIHRPFSWINSRLYVQRKLGEIDSKSGEETTSLVNMGEAKQEWHPWRRKYHLFLGQPEGDFHQFGMIDSGLLAWNFFCQNEGDVNIASIRKGWTGVGRELFTDTSQYSIRFAPDPDAPTTEVGPDGQPILPQVYKPLTLEERALVLALSVGIDFDYFSRHSEGGGGWGLPLLWIFTVFE